VHPTVPGPVEALPPIRNEEMLRSTIVHTSASQKKPLVPYSSTRDKEVGNQEAITISPLCGKDRRLAGVHQRLVDERVRSYKVKRDSKRSG
jgi:hypothetical protein